MATACMTTFSFHNRNERTATTHNLRAIRVVQYLSVSTIGTNELQPALTLFFNKSNWTFSFHNRNERTATRHHHLRRLAAMKPFSFHNRNERTATTVLVVQLGRREHLSVSTIGTNELQRGIFEMRRADVIAFSFHNRNERTATALPIADLGAYGFLSVSTIGTNELQPLPREHRVPSILAFQFPQSERTNCNVNSRYPFTALTNAFSFHNRNERTATERVIAEHYVIPDFQFPQSERTNCNPHRLVFVREIEDTFSFHNRNERTATE